MTIDHILCPVEFTDMSRHALQHAVVLSTTFEARLTVLHAYRMIEPVVGVGEAAFAATMIAPLDPDEILEETRQFCGPIAADVLVAEGDPAHAIVRYAEQLRADLIVMGKHGQSAMERLLIGSVTESVLRSTLTPVLTVPACVEHVEPGRYRSILCPMEFCDGETVAIEHALALAVEFTKALQPGSTAPAARLVLLHVVERADLPDPIASETRARLKALAPDEARQWIDPEACVTGGKPEREILRVASEIGAELIVMSVHGKGVLGRRLLRTTTSHVIRESPCPLLTMRG
jgi:nucleotide-binding universal stress UspA family protein